MNLRNTLFLLLGVGFGFLLLVGFSSTENIESSKKTVSSSDKKALKKKILDRQEGMADGVDSSASTPSQREKVVVSPSNVQMEKAEKYRLEPDEDRGEVIEAAEVTITEDSHVGLGEVKTYQYEDGTTRFEPNDF